MINQTVHYMNLYLHYCKVLKVCNSWTMSSLAVYQPSVISLSSLYDQRLVTPSVHSSRHNDATEENKKEVCAFVGV